MLACAEHPRSGLSLGNISCLFLDKLSPPTPVASYIQAALPTTLAVLGSDLQVCLCFILMPLTGTNFLPSAPCSVYTVE